MFFEANEGCGSVGKHRHRFFVLCSKILKRSQYAMSHSVGGDGQLFCLSGGFGLSHCLGMFRWFMNGFQKIFCTLVQLSCSA